MNQIVVKTYQIIIKNLARVAEAFVVWFMPICTTKRLALALASGVLYSNSDSDGVVTDDDKDTDNVSLEEAGDKEDDDDDDDYGDGDED